MRSRSDANQKEIVSALRKVGVNVEVHSAHGVGYDLLCRIPGRAFIIEVKPSPGIGKRGKQLARSWSFTEKEERLKMEWGDDYNVIETVDAALSLVARLRALG